MASLRNFGVVSALALVVLAAACGDDAEDACEHFNKLCATQGGGISIKADCSTASDKYDALSDADKEKADTSNDCVLAASDCAAALRCGGLGPGPGTSSSSGGPVTPAECDSSKCFTGNECLPLDGVTECRKTCSSNDDPATSCPFNYTCRSTDPENGIPPFCVATTALTKDGNALEKKEEGQWGWPCLASEGSKNPACDLAQGFYCYGQSPTDGEAYCTRYDCLDDNECGPGFACVDINTTPNVATAKRKFEGATQKVCLKRTYCSPCSDDVDCPTVEGTKQHCIVDGGGRGFCTPECTANQGCNTEAKCVTVKRDSGDFKICYPRSKVCIGNGDLCSSCLVDTDCGEDGLCVKGQYTTERFCIKKAPGGDCAQCPKDVPAPEGRQIGCAKTADEKFPAGYCLGIYAIGGQVGSDIGCWTPDR